jgi:hypothetical protein
MCFKLRGFEGRESPHFLLDNGYIAPIILPWSSNGTKNLWRTVQPCAVRALGCKVISSLVDTAAPSQTGTKVSASVSFFFHFWKVACEATSALNAVLNWLTFRFVGSFFGAHPQIIYLQVVANLLWRWNFWPFFQI